MSRNSCGTSLHYDGRPDSALPMLEEVLSTIDIALSRGESLSDLYTLERLQELRQSAPNPELWSSIGYTIAQQRRRRKFATGGSSVLVLFTVQSASGDMWMRRWSTAIRFEGT